MAMEIRQLNETETAEFSSERKWLNKILRHFGDEFALTRLPEDIPNLQSLLDVEPFASGDEAALEALGSAFGNVVANTLGLDWVVFTDEHGSDFAIKHPTKM